MWEDDASDKHVAFILQDEADSPHHQEREDSTQTIGMCFGQTRGDALDKCFAYLQQDKEAYGLCYQERTSKTRSARMHIYIMRFGNMEGASSDKYAALRLQATKYVAFATKSMRARNRPPTSTPTFWT